MQNRLRHSGMQSVFLLAEPGLRIKVVVPLGFLPDIVELHDVADRLRFNLL